MGHYISRAIATSAGEFPSRVPTVDPHKENEQHLDMETFDPFQLEEGGGLKGKNEYVV